MNLSVDFWKQKNKQTEYISNLLHLQNSNKIKILCIMYYKYNNIITKDKQVYLINKL